MSTNFVINSLEIFKNKNAYIFLFYFVQNITLICMVFQFRSESLAVEAKLRNAKGDVAGDGSEAQAFILQKTWCSIT